MNFDLSWPDSYAYKSKHLQFITSFINLSTSASCAAKVLLRRSTELSKMKGVPEPVALLLDLVLGLLGRVIRIEAFRLGLVESCGGHDYFLVVGNVLRLEGCANEAMGQIKLSR